MLNGHLELVPAFLYSLYLTLYKRTPVLNGHLELVPAFLYSLYLTVYRTEASVKRTPRVGPCLSFLP